MNTPQVSIIIAVFNAASTIKHCLDSVLAQQGTAYELIVIDGGSIDGTVEILRSYEAGRFNWISESDEGVYDAWNKGISRAKGKWIMFLGSDDHLATVNTLSDLISFTSRLSGSYDFVTVRNMGVGGKRNSRLWGGPWKWSEFRRYMSICHVGALHNADFFRKYGLFDTQYKIAGDYEILLRAGNELKTIDFPENVAFCGENGISRTQIRKAFLEAIKIHLRHGCSSPSISICRYGYSYLKQLFLRLGRMHS